MGAADVVPGVSGGTIAFVLGIYEAFIGALRSINLRWLARLLLWVGSGFKPKHLAAARQDFLSIHWGFLLPLVGGMGVAVVLASRAVPTLMENHPVQMRALFLGLVLASIAVPLKELGKIDLKKLAIALLVAASTWWMLGAKGSPPVRVSTEITSEATTLGAFHSVHPSIDGPVEAYCPRADARDNAPLRASVEAMDPQRGALLDTICKELQEAGENPEAVAAVLRTRGMEKSATNPFVSAAIGDGIAVQIARPHPVVIFLAGALAISAMALPGISGSFVLLIIGLYTFVFASLRGAIAFLTGGAESAMPLLYTALFAAGVLFGIMGFSRVLALLFERYREATLLALIGVMVGSLRVLWPFQTGSLHGGPTQNVLPTAGDPIGSAVFLCIVGFGVVVGLATLAKRLEARMESQTNDPTLTPR